MSDKSIDNAIVDPRTYAHVDEFHRLFTKLRAEDPVRWTEPDGYRPFWTVSKHADIMEVERQNDKFLNDPRLTLQTIEVEEKVKDERLQRLQALLGEQQAAFAASRLGMTMDVLIEKPGRQAGQRVGRSPWLQPVIVDEKAGEIGDIVSVRITKAGPNSLFSEPA